MKYAPLLPHGLLKILFLTVALVAKAATVTPDGGRSDAGPGQLWVLGQNNWGQLGNGTYDLSNAPILVQEDIVAISSTSVFSLFLKSDGTLWSVGGNSSGELGDGTVSTKRNTPHLLDSNVSAMAAGSGHTLYLTTSGILKGVGGNAYRTLGLKTGDYFTSPQTIESGIKAVSASYHSLYLRADNSLLGMGYNSAGALGPTYLNSAPPNPVLLAVNVKTFSAGVFHTLIVTNDGDLYALGNNQYGQLGDGTTEHRPNAVLIDTGVTAVAAGFHHSLYLKDSGTLRAMGRNHVGQLGDGTLIDRHSPVSISAHVIKIAAGYYHSLFVLADGTLKGMGLNNGRLGPDDLSGSISIPRIIASNVAAVAAGTDHSMFIVTGPPPAALLREDPRGFPAVYSHPISIAEAWTIETDAEWIAFSKTSGSGPETITITLSEHTGTEDREATITIGSVTYTITQHPADAYDAWLAGYLSEEERGDMRLTGPTDDADGDRLSNFFEFMAGLDPSDPDSTVHWWLDPAMPDTFRYQVFGNDRAPLFAEYSADFIEWTRLDGKMTFPGDDAAAADLSGLSGNVYIRLTAFEPEVVK